MSLNFTKKRLNLQKLSLCIYPKDSESLTLASHKLQKALEDMSRAVALSSLSCLSMELAMRQRGLTLGTSLYPFITEDNLYYNARNVIGQGPRYNNPNKDITGVGKEFIIFNYDALEMYRSVYICEGALNALTIGDRGIATMGKAISGYQVNELLKSSCERFIILLDPDAKKYAINLALKLVAYKKVKVVFLPEGKDVNDLGRKETLRLVYQTRYQSYQDLIQIRNSLE